MQMPDKSRNKFIIDLAIVHINKLSKDSLLKCIFIINQDLNDHSYEIFSKFVIKYIRSYKKHYMYKKYIMKELRNKNTKDIRTLCSIMNSCSDSESINELIEQWI